MSASLVCVLKSDTKPAAPTAHLHGVLEGEGVVRVREQCVESVRRHVCARLGHTQKIAKKACSHRMSQYAG